MPFILAVEPDRRQAAKIVALARGRLQVEVVTVDSATHALEVLKDRAPDLVLTSMLLSPREEAVLVDRLRELDATGTRVETLVIPVLGGPPSRSRRHDRSGLFSRLRGQRDVVTAEGCDPAVFAAQIEEYLQRVASERKAAAESQEPLYPGYVLAREPAATPSVLASLPEPAPETLRRLSLVEPEPNVNPEQASIVRAEPEPIFRDERVEWPSFRTAEPETTPRGAISAYPHDETIATSEPKLEATGGEDGARFESVILAKEATHEPVDSVLASSPPIPEEAEPLRFAHEPLAFKRAPQIARTETAGDTEGGSVVRAKEPDEPVIVATEPVFYALQPPHYRPSSEGSESTDEALVLANEPLDLASFMEDRDTEDSGQDQGIPIVEISIDPDDPSLVELSAALEPEPIEAVANAREDREAENGVNQSYTLGTDPITAEVGSIEAEPEGDEAALAGIGSEAQAIEEGLDAIESDRSLEAAPATDLTAPALHHEDLIGAHAEQEVEPPDPVAASSAPSFEFEIEMTASAWTPPPAPEPIEQRIPTRAPLEETPDLGTAPVPPAPQPTSESGATPQHDVLEMLLAIRRDLEHLRSVREAAPTDPAESPERAEDAGQPDLSERADPVDDGHPATRPVAKRAARAAKKTAPSKDKPDRTRDNTRTKKKKKKPAPVQDEWGFFDPEQCGFAALLEKLEEFTEDETPPADQDGAARVPVDSTE